MNKDEIKIKDCFVMLEPCTPKADVALSVELRKVINERNILTTKSKKRLISALDEIHSVNVEDKRNFRKNQTLQEILDSEVIYLNKLETIMNYFMKPIKNKNILTEKEYDVLFGSISNIYKVNGELLNELKQDLANNVASAFSKLAPFFKMYSVYAYDYKKSLELIESLHNRNPEFNKLLINQESRPEVQSKLSSLLIQPIQRIPRYCLLLRQLLDNTLPTDADYGILKGSLEKLEEVARHVDSLVEERENAQKLLELTRRLKNGNFLVIQPGRKLIKEGLLTSRINNKNEKCYIVLMNDVLMCCKLKKDNFMLPKSLKCITIFPLNKCTIDCNKNTKMFEVTCQDESLVLYHEKGSDSDEWLKIIDETIHKSITNRKTLKKGSSARRPAKNNLTSYMDYGVSPGVARVKKRRHTDDGDEPEVPLKRTQSTPTAGSSAGTGVWDCLPSRISRRRGIHSGDQPNGRDSLFPLRQHFLGRRNSETNNCRDLVTSNNPDLFVFGAANDRNHRFSFGLGNIFTGIGSSMKKMFGFK